MNARTNNTSSFARTAMAFFGAATLMACPAMAQSFVLHETPVAIETAAEESSGKKGSGLDAGGWVDPRVQIADYNQNGKVDAVDLYEFFFDWNAGKWSADINGDGWLDAADVWFYLEIWNSVITSPSGGKGSSK